MIDKDGGYTPTPVISHAILTYNKGRTSGLADGVVVTPSHNPPEDGGYKYNPPHGGPADTDVTAVVEKRANAYLADGLKGVKRIDYAKARKSANVARLRLHHALRRRSRQCRRSRPGQIRRRQYRHRSARRRRRALLASDHRALRPEGHRRERGDRSDLPLHDRRLGRQDPHGLLLALRDGEPDRDARPLRRRLCQRHRCRPPRHRDAHRRPDESEPLSLRPRSPICSRTARTGARMPRSARPWCRARSSTASRRSSAAGWSRRRSASNGSSTASSRAASASAARRVQAPRSCAATARCGPPTRTASSSACSQPRSWRRPAAIPASSSTTSPPSSACPTTRASTSPPTPPQKNILKSVTPEQLGLKDLAGDPVRATLSKAPGNGQPFGGIKVETDFGWFAARPSGTEDVYKIYAESFRGKDDPKLIQKDARAAIAKAF